MQVSAFFSVERYPRSALWNTQLQNHASDKCGGSTYVGIHYMLHSIWCYGWLLWKFFICNTTGSLEFLKVFIANLVEPSFLNEGMKSVCNCACINQRRQANTTAVRSSVVSIVKRYQQKTYFFNVFIDYHKNV